MAREHARIWLDINADDDFEKLPFDAQGFYCRVILTLGDLSYCGVADWRPKRLTAKAPDLTYERVQTAAWWLEDGRYCMFDLDTEEVLARSYIRRDELIRNPKMAAAVVKAYAGVASKMLRAAVVTEIRRVHDEHPEYSSWKHPDVGPALRRIMDKPGLDTIDYLPQIIIPLPGINGDANSVSITNPLSVPITNPVGDTESAPIPSTYTSTSTPAPLSGYVSRERHHADSPNPNDPPPRTCLAHPNGTAKPCRACAADRKAVEAWTAEQAAQRKADIDAKAERQRRCTLCDDEGWVLDDDRVPVDPAKACTHAVAISAASRVSHGTTTRPDAGDGQ